MVTCTVTDDKIVVWVDASDTDVVGWYYHIPVTSAMDDVVVREGDTCRNWMWDDELLAMDYDETFVVEYPEDFRL
jgi:hypothetical protein